MSKARSSILAATTDFLSHEDFLIDDFEEDIGIGPHGRNLAIWDEIIENFEVKYYNGKIVGEDKQTIIMEKQFKLHREAYIMIQREFLNLKVETSTGMAILDWQLLNMNRGEFSALILFHGGKVDLKFKLIQTYN